MSIARHHAEWLSLVETSGPFLSMPVLQRAFPQGLDEDPDKSETHALLRQAFTEWEESQEGSKPDPSIHREWVRFVLRRLLDFSDEVLAEGQALPPSLRVRFPEHGETLTPDIAVINPSGRPDAGKPRLLVSVVQSAQDLEKPLEGSRWKISAASRMIELLHAADVRLGLVTNGEHWMLVHAPRNETTGCASFYATIWLEEDITLRAFRSLLCQRRFFGVPDNDTPEALYAQSAEDQQEVTDQLGLQVRRAVEILVQCIDKLDRDSGRKLLSGFDEKVLYEAAVTTMMRLVFLLCAEERKLLPGESDIYTQHYAVSSLRTHLREAADRHGEEVLGFRYDMWSRLLAAFRAVHGGVGHESLRLPPYGGSLCDPDRFPFLEGRPQGSRWRDTAAQPLAIDNRTVLHLLEALQVLQVKVAGGGPAEARRLSFKALGIEQIGHVYEGLLDHTAKRASEPVLGLSGAKGQEPEISLASIESQKAKGTDALVEFLADETGRSKSALKRAVENPTLETEGALFAACGSDEKLVGRVRPFTALIRNDSMGYPVVIAEGSVFVTAGEDRRSTGTHYTPTSLTEPIVQHTLEPLVYDGPAEGKPREEWKLRSTKALLDLKVCDLAMGSGAFLVQTCRYLAERLVEAWDVLEREGGNLRITPEGEVAKGGATERIIPKSVEERLILAQRIVADRCLYGVDKNHMAVEMAKLSLWLVTMDKGKPFTFLDHALKGGDSLLGVDKEQLETWSLERGKKLKALDAFASKEIKNAIFARKKLEWISDDDIRAVEEKARIHREVERSLEKLKVAGDLIIATAFSSGSDIEPALEHSQAKFTAYQFAGGDDLIRQMAADAHRALGRHRPFHWPLEFPEVFLDEKRGGFDAIISNPPFQGGQKITGALGTEYRNYLVNHLAGGQRGSADLCAYFYLRANQLLRPWGQFGMLATNTIAQGDTREVGLEQITRDGGVITRAIPSMKWPGVANLEVAIVWVTKGKWYGQHLLGDLAADHITEYLTTKGATAGKPFRLKANENKSFQGSIVLGMGFILTPEEAQALIKKDKRNREVLFPYLNGEDLNSRPDQSPSRWVINFFDWSIEKAKEYRDCFKIVEDKVKPERLKNNRKVYRDNWWQFAEKRPAFYRTIAGMERVYVSAEVSKHINFSAVPNSQVYSHMLIAFSMDDSKIGALLQSTIHEVWARDHGSTLETRFRYTPSDCFETFPFPAKLDRLDKVGERYFKHRNSVMQARPEGLTKTYNRMHNPKETAEDIERLRKLHVEMDQAVAAVYGWKDLDLGHGFHETKQGIRFTISEAARREVLDRLLALNHERYEEEVKQGLHDSRSTQGRAEAGGGRKDKKKAGKAAAKKRDAKGKGQTTLFPEPEQGEMFKDEEDG